MLPARLMLEQLWFVHDPCHPNTWDLPKNFNAGMSVAIIGVKAEPPISASTDVKMSRRLLQQCFAVPTLPVQEVPAS
jgi:hypothetical protein